MGLLGGQGQLYDPKECVPLPVAEARRAFLNRLCDVAPEVPRHLRNIALAAYREELVALGGGVDWKCVRYRPADSATPQTRLDVALSQWARTWHLNAEWCLEIAAYTLGFWLQYPTDPLFFVTPQDSVQAPPPEFHFVAAWGIRWESEEGFVTFARERFEKELGEYVERVKQEAKARGWVEAPEKREFGKHLEMLVRWQCQGWTLREIAKVYGYGQMKVNGRFKDHTGISGVTKALDRIAAFIGLERREGQQGRPRPKL